MFFTIALYSSLALCAAGLAWRLWLWLSLKIGPEAAAFTPGQRAAQAAVGLLRTILSPRLGRILRALAREGLFQRRSAAHDRLAWAGHQCIFWGFTYLLLLHALEKQVLVPLVRDYANTLQPWLFLRNLAGTAVLAGVGIAIHRRRTIPGLKRITRGVDSLALATLAVIIISGFALEGAKIVSPVSFERMVESYSSADEAELPDLRAYWARDYGVAFPQAPPAGSEALERGRKVHEQDCASCHDRPQWAFLSYGLSRLLSPAAVSLSAAGLERGLWYIHFLACFLAMALLPWTKFLHLFTAPLRLAIKEAASPGEMHPANLATLRAMELDACTHCGACSLHCSVGVALREVPNLTILPSEKLAALKRLAQGKAPDRAAYRQMRQGSYICTSCLRCTTLCPSGINLQELWLAMKADLAQAGYGPTYVEMRERAFVAAQPSRSQPQVKLGASPFRKGMGLSAQAGTFSNCFRCVTCSNVCPVVHTYQEPREHLDLLPHQIMHALGLGLREEALGARMVWDCLTCYHCQEACPQGVRVTDVLHELRLQASEAMERQES